MSNLYEGAEQLSSSQQILLILKEARAQLEAVERSKTEPIAIIGMGCRFPGGANDPETFWQLLHDGIDAISEVPLDRWNIDNYYDSDPETPGKMYTRGAGFLQGVDQFDPQFFGISPREAVRMDPQQRLLLEVSWEALEKAGQAPEKLIGSQTGVFVGIGQNDYLKLLLKSGDSTHINTYDGTGNGLCFASGRLSYVLGLQGPNMAVDTGCSSSLIAVHLACHSLRARECNLALAGGVHLNLLPESTIFLSKTRALSPDGRCKTFDASANGFSKGEGCGIIVLKRLSDAIANQDPILALLQGSAINHDGPSSGLTVPNQIAQEELIRQALKNARVEPSQVSYVEAHGTGTSLGDPIEVGALGTVFGQNRPQDYPLVIGSVKTNFGHLEAAAGIAGLIKVVLALQHQEIPPHLHLHKPNPHIAWNKIPVVVPTRRMPWRYGEKRRIAGVSAFGMSGTNAHIVLEEAPISEPVQGSVERSAHLLMLSAKTEEALVQLAQRYEKHLAANPDLAVADVCFTTNTGRSHFKHRLSVVAESLTEAQEKLAAFSAGEKPVGVFQGQSIRQPKVAFLFTGHGCQYLGMGRQLYDTQPTFRQTLNRCDQILRPYLEKPLLSVLYPAPGESSPLDETAYTQPALFALEYALFQLWKSWGIEPAVVMGHGLGEYVAACVAGVFSLEDALYLIARRVQLMQTLPASGEMVTAFEEVAASISYHLPRIPLVSSVTEQQICNEIATSQYWVNQVRQPVQFYAGMTKLQQQSCEIFVEISPTSILLEMGGQCLSTEKESWLASWQQGQSDWQVMLNSLAVLSMKGITVDWQGFDRDYCRRRVPLPTYPFQRQRFWVENTDRKSQALPLWQEEVVAAGDRQAQQAPLDLSISTDSSKLESLDPLTITTIINVLQDILVAQTKLTSAKPGETLNQIHKLIQKHSSRKQAMPANEPTLPLLQLQTAPAETCKQFLVSYFKQLLSQVAPISSFAENWEQQSLDSFGIDSLMFSELKQSIKNDLATEVPIELFWSPSIDQFLTNLLEIIKGVAPVSVRQLEETQLTKNHQATSVVLPPSSTKSWIVRPEINAKPSLRLFCFPHAGGGASTFHAWAKAFAPGVEVCAIQLPGRENRLKEPCFTRLKALIETLASVLYPYLDLPFAFFGHSLGALISFELARELRRCHQLSPVHLFVSTRRAPQLSDLDLPIHQLPDPKFVTVVQNFQGIPEEILLNSEFMNQFLPALRADFAILETYVYKVESPLICPITAYGGLNDSKVSTDDIAAWREQTRGEFTLQQFPGGHFFLQEQCQSLLQHINQQLGQQLQNQLILK